MLGGCGDGLDLVEVEMAEVLVSPLPIVVANPIYRGPGPLPEY